MDTFCVDGAVRVPQAASCKEARKGWCSVVLLQCNLLRGHHVSPSAVLRGGFEGGALVPPVRIIVYYEGVVVGRLPEQRHPQGCLVA